METNLPELCRRVWGKVPAAIPYDCEDHLSVVVPKRPDEEPRWYIPGRTHAISDDMAESMIQAAALRWLLDHTANTLKIASSKRLDLFECWQDDEDWFASSADLTTCLLLAVERCQEYKESKE